LLNGSELPCEIILNLALFLALATGYLLGRVRIARSSWGRLWDVF